MERTIFPDGNCEFMLYSTTLDCKNSTVDRTTTPGVLSSPPVQHPLSSPPVQLYPDSCPPRPPPRGTRDELVQGSSYSRFPAAAPPVFSSGTGCLECAVSLMDGAFTGGVAPRSFVFGGVPFGGVEVCWLFLFASRGGVRLAFRAAATAWYGYAPGGPPPA